MKEGFKMRDKEYKLMKDFGKLVPGMVFQIESGRSFSIVDIYSERIMSLKWEHLSQLCTGNINLELEVKLIYDPRVVKKTLEVEIREKISEHKKQIEILEEELKNQSLKNVFKIGSVYRIQTSHSLFICKVLKLNNNYLEFVGTESNHAKQIQYSEIVKVFNLVCLDDMFKYVNPIFERKV